MTRADTRSIEAEVRVSPEFPIAVLALLGVAFGAVAESLGLLPTAVIAILSLELLAGVALLLCHWRPRVGAGVAIVALVAAIQVTNNWLRAPGILALMAVPCLLAAGTLGLPALLATALGETALLLFLFHWGLAGAEAAALAVALLGIWSTVGVTLALYRPVYRALGWSWGQFEQVRTLLEQARDRRLELNQVLQDLADANLQLTRLNRLAQALRQTAEEARQAKQQFVANVSHELRTPLNMILGFSEMMLHAPSSYGVALPPALLADLDVILRNSRHLAGLIDDVLDLSQIEAGRMALVKERVALEEVVEAAVAAVRPLFASRGLYLNTELPAELPPVFCDRTRIREVLLNLLSNAGRFTEQGGVCVRVRSENEDVVISVSDTGPGIAGQDMDRVFRPFQQLDGSLSRVHDGSGLGLSISKAFVELHGGKMWLESQVGVGTTFFVLLPIAPPLPAADDATLRWFNPHWQYDERTRPSAAPVASMRPRFVVLDRGETLQRLVGRYVDGAEIVAATDLDQALQELAHVPAQALLVNEISVGDALQCLSHGAALPNGTPAIVCNVPGSQQAAASLAIADYLVKPVTQERLLAALDRLHLAGRTILIVDDEPDAQQLFQRMLAAAGKGYRVLRAAEGQQALSIARTQRPDAVLLDLAMPEMDGFRFLEERAGDPALRDIPVLVVSARDPSGQPIVSGALGVVRGGGISTAQLLACVQAISEILATIPLPAGPKQPGRPSG